jgi:GTP-binding protein
VDLLPSADRKRILADIVARCEWDGPVFPISALTGEGTQALARAVVTYLEETAAAEKAAAKSG